MKKHLNIEISTSTYKEMQALCEEMELESFIVLIRRSLAFFRIAIDHIGPDGSITIVTTNGAQKIFLLED